MNGIELFSNKHKSELIRAKPARVILHTSLRAKKAWQNNQRPDITPPFAGGWQVQIKSIKSRATCKPTLSSFILLLVLVVVVGHIRMTHVIDMYTVVKREREKERGREDADALWP